MRCDSCNKFVGLELNEEPEEESLDVNEDGVVTGDVRIVRTCMECSQELKDAHFTVDVDLSAEVAAHRADYPGIKADEHDELSVEWESLSVGEARQTQDRHGKRISNPRYQKTLFVVDGVVRVTCKCGETFTDNWTDHVQASGMDELI
jgi:hypothetical protein